MFQNRFIGMFVTIYIYGKPLNGVKWGIFEMQQYSCGLSKNCPREANVFEPLVPDYSTVCEGSGTYT